MSGVEDFSGFEVIRAAMEVEKQGRQFYGTLSTRAKNPLAREIFTLLAQDEIGHLRTLEQMVDTYRDGEFWDNEEEFLPYLRRFSSERVFPSSDQVAEVLEAENADILAIDLAIAAEEQFAAYFQLAAANARNRDGQEAFAWLAAEEQRHARVLKERRQKLAGG